MTEEYKKTLKEIINDYRKCNMDATNTLTDDEVLMMYPIKEEDVRIYILGKRLSEVKEEMEGIERENEEIEEQLRSGGIPPHERTEYYQDKRNNNLRMSELRVKYYDTRKELLGVRLDGRSNSR